MRPSFLLTRSVRPGRRLLPPLGRPCGHATRSFRLVAGPLGAAGLALGVTVTAVLAGGAAGDGSTGRRTDAVRTVGSDRSVEAGSVGRIAANGSTAEAFRAGELGISEAPLPGAIAAARVDLAARTASILGLPAATRRTATRVADEFGGRTYDEVTEYDAGDRLVSLQRFDVGGRLLAAVRFGWRSAGGAALAGETAVRQRAERLAVTLGLAPGGVPRVVTAPSGAGWTVAWDRTVDGVAVPGDGLRIQLWPDGSVHGLSRSERALADRPAGLLDAARARSLAEAQLGTWFGGDARGHMAISGLSLAWVPPNDTFAPAGPDAPGAVLRLAWVVRAGASGPLAESLRALEIYLDAGTGAVIGGDILE